MIDKIVAINIKRKTPIGDGNVFFSLFITNSFNVYKKKDPDRGRKPYQFFY